MQSFSSYDIMMSLLEEIRGRIKDRPDMTQAKLAREIGVSREHLNRMLSNKCPIKGEILIHLMKALNLNSLPTR